MKYPILYSDLLPSSSHEVPKAREDWSLTEIHGRLLLFI